MKGSARYQVDLRNCIKKSWYIFINSALRSENKFEENTNLVLCLWLHLHNLYGQSAIAICLSIGVPSIRDNLTNWKSIDLDPGINRVRINSNRWVWDRDIKRCKKIKYRIQWWRGKQNIGEAVVGWIS